MSKTNLLKKIKEEIITLKESPLYKLRIENSYFPVIGEGNHDAKLVFVGEAPGGREAATGRPFCGSAGKILTECLKEIGIERKDVYITNILKDRPPKNRDPLPNEIELYASFLDRQIEIIKPSLIAPLGRFSGEYIMRRYGLENKIKPITKMHGNLFRAQVLYGELKIIPLLHPAVAIYNRSKRDILMKGFYELKNNI